ncbi:MAG: hypothetical protein HXY22_03665 [Alphaproteobacteria bacterium]|nr:hypothetical protein [Alphaproteobacteria bacterium]
MSVQRTRRAPELRQVILEALMVLEATLSALDLIRERLAEIEETLVNATEGGEGARAFAAARYRELREAIDETAALAERGGFNLIAGARSGIEITLGKCGQGAIAIGPVDLRAAEGLGLPPIEDEFADTMSIDRARDALAAAQTRLARASQVFIADAAMLSKVFQDLPREV